MKIPSCILDAIAAMNSEECDFFNIEFHSDNLILINIKRMGEIFPRHYTFTFNDSFKIDNVTLEVMLPERNNKAWNDNGYPEQGSTIYYKLDPIMSILDLNDLHITCTEADIRRFNRMHCNYSHNMLSIEVATKPSVNTLARITFEGRMKYDEQYKTRI